MDLSTTVLEAGSPCGRDPASIVPPPPQCPSGAVGGHMEDRAFRVWGDRGWTDLGVRCTCTVPMAAEHALHAGRHSPHPVGTRSGLRLRYEQGWGRGQEPPEQTYSSNSTLTTLILLVGSPRSPEVGTARVTELTTDVTYITHPCR